ncbi:MAG: hypothetical protein JO368_01995 [Acidimicrobiales bacterium]|nr:hypothetical protein [Acidimicrobiales bacterium]
MKKQPARMILAIIAAATAAGALSSAAVSYAGDGTAAPRRAASANAPASILPGVRGVLDSLVSQGRITQAQADAVQRQANTGTIDPKALVQSGVITDAQMHLVANGIEQVKLAGK